MEMDEFEILRSQFVTSKSDRMGLRYAPFGFIEQGDTKPATIVTQNFRLNNHFPELFIFTEPKTFLLFLNHPEPIPDFLLQIN